MPHLSPLYRFLTVLYAVFGFGRIFLRFCGFRWFFPSVLRLLIYPNAPLNILWIEPLCLCFTQFSGNSYCYNFDKIRHRPWKKFWILNFFLLGCWIVLLRSMIYERVQSAFVFCRFVCFFLILIKGIIYSWCHMQVVCLV